MGWSFRIGSVLGTEVRLHATFALLILWIGLSAWLNVGPAAAAVNVAFVLALFLCVLAHEFGHVLMARRFGISTPDITLLPIGGMARMQRMPERPSQEVAVALAGPAVNVLIWAILAGVVGAQVQIDQLATIENPAAGFWGRLAAVNLFIALFNLLPAFPMDGGRVLRALLASVMARPKATRLAARAGQAMAFLFGLAGLMMGNPLLVLIGVFVFFAAGAESADVALQDMARHLCARDAMITQFETLVRDDRLEAAAAALIRSTQHEFPVLEADGTLAGFLTREALFAGMAKPGGALLAVADLMRTDITRLALVAPLRAVLDALHDTAPVVAVCDAQDRLLGYITSENIGELMILRGRAAA